MTNGRRLAVGERPEPGFSSGGLSRFAVSGAARAEAFVEVMRTMVPVCTCLCKNRVPHRGAFVLDYRLFPRRMTRLQYVAKFQCRPPTVFQPRLLGPHLQADENFDVAGVAACLGGGNTPLAKSRRELRPLFVQFTARAVLVREALP